MRTRLLISTVFLMSISACFAQAPVKKPVSKFQSNATISDSLFGKLNFLPLAISPISVRNSTSFDGMSYDWAKLAKKIPNYNYILYDFRKQDANGRDLIQPVITQEMTDKLLRRELPR